MGYTVLCAESREMQSTQKAVYRSQVGMRDGVEVTSYVQYASSLPAVAARKVSNGVDGASWLPSPLCQDLADSCIIFFTSRLPFTSISFCIS
jgi:hypothetical protein